MSISPKVSMWLSIAVAVLGVFSSGVLARPSFVSDQIHRDILAIAGDTAAILGAAMAVLHGYSSATAGPFVSKATSFCLAVVAGCVAYALILPSNADAKTPRPLPRPQAFTLQTPDQLIDKIRLWATSDAGADLDAAILVGNSEPKNPVTVPCFMAIRDFVTRVQKLPTADKLPKLHLAVDIEILTDLEIQLLPNSPVILACTALANFQAVSAQNLVTGIVSGALALSKFAPVIPPI